MKKIGIIILLALMVSSCVLFQGDNHATVCRELNKRIVLNGATVNQRAADIQRSELGNLQATYRKEGCDN